ncbi:unnamed protein product, partial [Urochloa humidicola]
PSPLLPPDLPTSPRWRRARRTWRRRAAHRGAGPVSAGGQIRRMAWLAEAGARRGRDEAARRARWRWRRPRAAVGGRRGAAAAGTSGSGGAGPSALAGGRGSSSAAAVELVDQAVQTGRAGARHGRGGLLSSAQKPIPSTSTSTSMSPCGLHLREAGVTAGQPSALTGEGRPGASGGERSGGLAAARHSAAAGVAAARGESILVELQAGCCQWHRPAGAPHLAASLVALGDPGLMPLPTSSSSCSRLHIIRDSGSTMQLPGCSILSSWDLLQSGK